MPLPRYFSLPAIVFGFTIAGCAFAADDSTGAQLQRQTFHMTLGAPSGAYTDWTMDVRGFRELSATLDVPHVDGKPRDKWSALVRIALDGPGTGKDQRHLSLMVIHDRKTKTRSAVVELDDGRTQLPFDLPDTGKVSFTLARAKPGYIRVGFGDVFADVACDFEIRAIRALGSGLDVFVDPMVVVSTVGDPP